MSDEPVRWDLQPRVWRQAPPASALRGSWCLSASLSVMGGRAQVTIYVDAGDDPRGGYQRRVWRSIPLKTRVPATYTEAIPLVSEALWELSMAFQGIGIRFEQS